ncbi:MAG: type I-B CRISPR-associated protein Cas8b1/Cst1 [Thermodesulfobacteriota bacterium]|nr:type I-B CRISPR-associated protein Cas8b1/Cst1 [Thermodesulfobacteriota bacterium]
MKNDDAHLKETVEPGVFAQWQQVDVEIIAFTDLGIKVAINGEYTGLVYGNQVYGDYQKGQRIKAYIKLVREDGKIDVSMQPNKGSHALSTTDKILAYLKAAGGKIGLNDKSSPEAIKTEFRVSKKVFKRAIGILYRQNKIKITDKGIELVK